jgi:O-antigen/teichoic acid export membrane protein
MTLISFNTNIPRYFIEHSLGTRELGIFAAMAYPMLAGATIISALCQATVARLSQHYSQGEYHCYTVLLLKLIGFGMILAAAGVLVVWFAGAPILALLYRPEYTGYVHVFLWLAIATGISHIGTFLGNGMTAARYLRAQVPVFLAGTLVTAAFCAMLIPRFGLVGAAIAVTLAASCQTAGSGLVVLHAVRHRNGV